MKYWLSVCNFYNIWLSYECQSISHKDDYEVWKKEQDEMKEKVKVSV